MTNRIKIGKYAQKMLAKWRDHSGDSALLSLSDAVCSDAGEPYDVMLILRVEGNEMRATVIGRDIIARERAHVPKSGWVGNSTSGFPTNFLEVYSDDQQEEVLALYRNAGKNKLAIAGTVERALPNQTLTVRRSFLSLPIISIPHEQGLFVNVDDCPTVRAALVPPDHQLKSIGKGKTRMIEYETFDPLQ